MKRYIVLLVLSFLAQKSMTLPVTTTTYAWATDKSCETVVAGQSMTINAWTATQAAYSYYPSHIPLSQPLSVNKTPVKFNLPFTNHAVIQRDQPIPIYGTADPNDSLTITLDGEIRKIKVGADGSWKCTFPAKTAKSIAFTLSAEGPNSQLATVSDLLCGDVWVASGQSNMYYPVAPGGTNYNGVNNYAAEVSSANFPNIRFIQPANLWQQSKTPQKSLITASNGWTICSPSTVSAYSAVAYYFARTVHLDQNVPVGIVVAAISGTPIESWTPIEALQATSEYASAYNTATTVALPTTQNDVQKNFPSGNYNGFLAPYTLNPIKGIIWYQGESNFALEGTLATKEYGNKFKATIQAWRNAWSIANLPVIFTELANFQYSVSYAAAINGSKEALPKFKTQQRKATELTNVYGITISDVSNYTNIHPTDKAPVGRRMGNVALEKIYEKTGIVSCPAIYKSLAREGNTLRIKFENNTGFYIASGTAINEFKIAGIGKSFIQAKAILDGNDILVSDPTLSISKPVYVKFAWDENSIPNLYNASQTPTSCFYDSLSYTTQAIDTLQMAIDNAKLRKAMMTMGTEPGQYMPGVVSAFNQKISEATAIANNATLTDAAYRIAADSMNAQTIYYKAALNYPKISTAQAEYWYTFSTPQRSNYYIAYQGDNTDLKGEAYVAGTNKLLWKLTKNADGTYNIISKVSGSYISPASAANTALKAQPGTPASGGWKFVPTFNSNYFAIVSGTAQLNQTNSGLSYKIYNWGGGSNLTDAGCQYLIKAENTNQNQQKIACVGNSITYGYTLANPGTQSYPAQLQNMLGTYDWTVTNYGVSSRTMLKKGNLPYWNETAYTNALASNPNYVIIELGTNDAKTTNWNTWGYQFSADYKAMIKSFRNLSSKPEIWIAQQPPGQNIGWTIYNSYIKDSVNTRIKQVAIEMGTGLVDLYSAFNGDYSNTTYFHTDAVHPTMAGAGVIAQKVYDLLTAAKPSIIYANGKISCSATSFDSQWYRNDTIISIAEGGKNFEFTPTRTGIYKLSIQSSATSESRIVSSPLNITSLSTGVKSITGLNDFKVSVSKSKNTTLRVEFDQNFQQYKRMRVFSEDGKILLTQPIRQSIETATVSCSSSKVLIVEIFGRTGNKITKVLLR